MRAILIGKGCLARSGVLVPRVCFSFGMGSGAGPIARLPPASTEDASRVLSYSQNDPLRRLDENGQPSAGKTQASLSPYPLPAPMLRRQRCWPRRVEWSGSSTYSVHAASDENVDGAVPRRRLEKVTVRDPTMLSEQHEAKPRAGDLFGGSYVEKHRHTSVPRISSRPEKSRSRHGCIRSLGRSGGRAPTLSPED